MESPLLQVPRVQQLREEDVNIEQPVLRVKACPSGLKPGTGTLERFYLDLFT